MSIIYDALQKIQQHRENKYNIIDQERSNRLSWFDIGLLAIIACLLVVVIITYFPRMTKHSAAAAKPPAPVAQTLPPVDLTKLILSGIFVSDRDKIAVINNHYYHLGEIINGMRIINIQYDRVHLQYGNRIFILKS